MRRTYFIDASQRSSGICAKCGEKTGYDMPKHRHYVFVNRVKWLFCEACKPKPLNKGYYDQDNEGCVAEYDLEAWIENVDTPLIVNKNEHS